MTKTELLAELAVEYYAVRTPIHKGDIADLQLKVYEVECWKMTGDFLSRKTVPFYVFREGEANERGFYAGNESSKWLAKVEAYVSSRIADDTVIAAYRLHCDMLNKRAYYKVIFDNSGSLEERFYNIRQNADDSWGLERVS